MLKGTLSLHDVRDVEALCARVLQQANLELSHHDSEDLLAYLVETCWELSLRYEAGTGSTNSFAGWATTNLRLRVIDWQRVRFGRTKWQHSERTYERPRPQLHSLDDDQLASIEYGRLVDSAPDRSTDLMRVLRGGSGGSSRRDQGVGEAAPSSASRRVA